MDYTPIIPTGTKVEPYGVVVAIHSHAGERSYFMVDEDGVVTMMPEELMPCPTDTAER